MDKIIIDSVAPEGIGDDLKGCFYKPRNDGAFDFYDKDGKIKARDLKEGSSFSFQLDGQPDIPWSLTIKTITDLNVTGNWTNAPQEVGEPEGTYQGQAGGGSDVESAASASGY